MPDGAGSDVSATPGRHRPYRFVRYLQSTIASSWQPSRDYFGGTPANDGLVLQVVPDDIMRGLELRKGTVDLVVNDLSPDIVYQLRRDEQLQTATAPGVDYQYIGLNLRDPVLQDVRVRQALAYAIDRQAIVEHLRRGLATPADGLLPPIVVGLRTWHRRRIAYDPATRAGAARRGRLSAIRTATVPRRGCGSR